MRLYLFAFGKVRTPGLREAADYYLRLLRPWADLEEIELKPMAVSDKSSSVRARVQEQEGILLLEKVREKISNRGAFFILDEKGSALPTTQWTQRIQEWELRSIPSVAFCIGSSLGFSEHVRSQANGSLSLGPQTLSHELARTVVLEQLYRAYSLHKGHPYHNEG